MDGVRRYLVELITGVLQDVGTDFSSTDLNESFLEDLVVAPYYAEKTLSYGTLICFDSFLYSAVILPLRAASALTRPLARLEDLLRFLAIVLVYKYLCTINVSSIYHSFKNQPGMTVYVIYGVTDVCDKFLCTVGFAVGNRVVNLRPTAGYRRALFYTAVNVFYTAMHSFVLIWQFVTINIAVNSYKNALMSYVIIHLFGKVRSIILKRFKYATLLQTMTGDIVQRFKIMAIVTVIILRNLLEAYHKNGIPDPHTLRKICGPPLMLLFVDFFLDWMKYSYVTTFNGMQPRTLFESFLTTFRVEYSNYSVQAARGTLAKQIGWPVTPLLIICVRMFAKGGSLRTWLTPVLYALMMFAQAAASHCLRECGKIKPRRRRAKKE